jgi:predicted AlkP superfamily pyrophosphatase or phosphodiesterase
MKLRIPNLRKLMREGEYSKGIIGVFPTITWPSHTTLITGVDPVTHGILGNWRPPGDRYLDYSQIKVPNLIGAAHAVGLKTAAITWPVTVGAPVDWNLPEYFEKRQGGSMDTRSVESKSNPTDLVSAISRVYRSFPQEWMDDRTRTLSVLYLLEHEKPDLLLVHLVDLDSEEHENAPFTRESNAVVERTDELIGQMMRALPPGSALAVVSDHRFERVDRIVNIKAIAAKNGAPDVIAAGGVVIAPDTASADVLRRLRGDPQNGLGCEIPSTEYVQFPSNLPPHPAAAFESADHVMFSFGGGGELFSKPQEIGNHGHWPMRHRSVFLLAGPSISHRELPEFSIKEIAGRLAAIIGVELK